MNLKLWMRAVRAPFFTAAIIPVLLGYLLAWHDKAMFVWSSFVLTLIGAVFIHAGTNMANDYFDHRSGCDKANPTPTPFSGGSRVIQDGLMSPRRVLGGALVFFAMGSAIGLYLNAVCGGNMILILGLIGVGLAVFYSARPLRLGYGSLGELATAAGFGPLMVMGAYYVGAGSAPFKVFLVSLPVGILIGLVLFINEFPDWQGDRTVGKRTWVVLLGKKKAAWLYRIFLAAAYAVIGALVIAGSLPFLCLLAFLSLPLAIKAFKISRDHYAEVPQLLPANAATIGLHALVGVLLCAGIVLDRLFFG